MRIAHPSHFLAYTKCPRRLQLNWDAYSPNPTLSERIVTPVIQNIYQKYARKGKAAGWKQVIAWTERYVLENIIFSNRQETYRATKGYFTKIGEWYDKYAADYAYPGIINIPVGLELGPRLIYKDYIPVLILSNPYTVADIYELRDTETLKGYNGLKLYDDFELMLRCWGFWKSTGIFPSKYVRFTISHSVIKPIHVYIREKRLLYIEKLAEQIARGIHEEIFYPSRSEQCNSCPFIEDCHL